MSFIYEILPDRIVNALGWTIMHSLWQGLVIGVFLFLLLYFYRHHSSNLRYNISVFSLVLICGLFFLTFVINYKVAERTSLFSSNGNWFAGYNINEADPLPISSGIQTITPANSLSSITDKISGTFPFVISFWLLGVFIITVHTTGGFFMTQRLRNSCLYPLPEELQERFQKLTGLMKIRRLITVCESTLVHVPVVIGYFKPVILLPFSAISHIPCDQVEAIIAHELAHIRRNDYLVNVFQSITEALFFYNPIIWIINYRIRKERENCCDDLAVSYSSGKLTYAKALASIYEIPAKYGFPLLAVASKKYRLLPRILRIFKQGTMKTNLRDKFMAGFVLLSAIIIILFNTGGTFISFNSAPGYPAQQELTKQDGKKTISEDLGAKISENQIKADYLLQINKNAITASLIEPSLINNPALTPFPKRVEYNVLSSDSLCLVHPDTSLKVKDNIVQRTFIKDGKEMKIKMRIENDEIKELFVNGEKIPKDNYNQYQAEIDKTLEDLAGLQEKLAEAREKLEEVDMEEIRKNIEKSLEEVKESMQEIDFEAIISDIEEIEIPEIDEEKIRIEIENAIAKIEDIDMEKIHREFEKAMDSVCEAMKNIESPDIDKIKIEMEMAIKEIEEIDHGKIRAEIEKSISEIKIDREKIRMEMEKVMKELDEIDIDDFRIDLEKEKNKMDEMFKELEKLEIKKK